jgi:hypothetical protein
MNIESMANYADVIGGIAVVASLIFVGLQIRKNTQVSQGLATQQTYASTQIIYSWHANNSEVSELWTKFHKGEALTIAETVRNTQLMLGMIEQYQVYFVLHQLKLLDDESFRSFFRKILLVLPTPTSRQWFTTNRNFFRRDFVEYVDNLLDENPHVFKALSTFYGLESTSG